MQLIKALLDAPATLSAASNYTIANGIVYIASGLVLVVWPAVVQWLFLDADFVGHEASLVRVIGLTVGIIGWLYVFGGRSGGHQVVAATVVDRLLFVPIVLVPVALSGTCPHLLVTFLILDPCLALGAWWMLSRKGQQ